MAGTGREAGNWTEGMVTAMAKRAAGVARAVLLIGGVWLAGAGS